ncbi:thermonuclease family protein [Methylomagnum sp.]
MKTLSLFLALFCLVPLSGHAAPEFTGRVVRVGDGKSCWLLARDGGRQVKINLAQIDAPGTGQFYGRQAKSALAGLVLNREVHVDVVGRNSDGTIIGTVWVNDINVNATLLYQGWARVVARQVARDWVMVALQESAKAEHRGQWASPLLTGKPPARRSESAMARPRSAVGQPRLNG